MKNPYDVLGFTEEERRLQGEEFKKILKKKFKKLSLEHHPDRHVNDSEDEKLKHEELFKDITTANDILKDDDKRNQFDRFGNLEDGGGWSEDEFAGAFARHFRDMYQNGPASGKNLSLSLTLTLKEILEGCEKTLKYEAPSTCPECNGKGSKDGVVENCSHCHGTGRMRMYRQNGPFQQIIETTCTHCQGRGKIVHNPCPRCNGEGVTPMPREVSLKIPKGVYRPISLKGYGCAPNLYESGYGDLIIHFQTEENKGFQRYASNPVDVIKKIEVPILDAITGVSSKLDMYDDTSISINIPKGTVNGKTLRLVGKGLPYENSDKRGDLYLLVETKMPADLTESELKTINGLKKSKNFS